MLVGHFMITRIQTGFLGQRSVLINRAPHRHARKQATPRAELKNKGKEFDHTKVQVKGSLGEGSFGQVFYGTLQNSNNGKLQDVILKRVKSRVAGAQEMQEMEHLLNVYASSAAKRAVAPFLGYLEVPDDGINQRKLTTGLWLVWQYEGDKTLAYYLRRRDCISALAEDLGIEENVVVPTVMQQIFENLNDLHNAGIVHRDVKPANIVFAENERRFKFIDLGAAADLRTGTNYSPTETILDPVYCPPEQYILPTDAPNFKEQSAPLAMVMSPLLWSRHRPDCFDTWSCGVVLLQLALPFLRTSSAVKNWRGTLVRFDNDLEEWRVRSLLNAKQTALLDVDDGLGWDLAINLLRPREVESDSKGVVRFVNTGSAPRLTAAQALKHPFIKRASKGRSGTTALSGLTSLFTSSVTSSMDSDTESTSATTAAGYAASSGGSGKRSVVPRETSSSSGSSSSSSSKNSGLFTTLWERVKDVEARVMKQASDTQTQSKVVEQLRKDVAKGKASAEELRKEEGNLLSMQQRLQSSVKDLGVAFSSAKSFFGGGGGSGKESIGGSEGRSSSSSGAQSGSQGRKQAAASSAAPDSTAAGGGSKQESSTSSSGALTGFATNAIYTGLKWTGRAVQGMAELADSATQSLAKAQAEAEAQRAARSILIKVLQDLNPPLTFNSTWDQVKPLLPPADKPKANYAALTERQVRNVVETFVTALKEAEQKRQKALITSFDALLQEANANEDTTYDNFAAKYRRDPRFVAIIDDDVREAAFDDYLNRLQGERERKARKELEDAKLAAAQAERAALKGQQEADFRKLLQENETMVASTDDWAQVKRALWVDKRWDAVPELRRRELFAEYKDILKEAGVTRQKAAAAAKVKDLELLKSEQAKLKEEYDMIASKLQAMEKQLQINDLVGSLMEEVVVEKEESDKAVTFKFEEGGTSGLEDDDDYFDDGEKAPAKRGRKKVEK